MTIEGPAVERRYYFGRSPINLYSSHTRASRLRICFCCSEMVFSCSSTFRCSFKNSFKSIALADDEDFAASRRRYHNRRGCAVDGTRQEKREQCKGDSIDHGLPPTKLCECPKTKKERRTKPAAPCAPAKGYDETANLADAPLRGAGTSKLLSSLQERFRSGWPFTEKQYAHTRNQIVFDAEQKNCDDSTGGHSARTQRQITLVLTLNNGIHANFRTVSQQRLFLGVSAGNEHSLRFVGRSLTATAVKGRGGHKSAPKPKGVERDQAFKNALL